VAAVLFSPDGKVLASGDIDSHIIIWDTRTWKVRQRLWKDIGGIGYLAFTPDSKQVFASGEPPVLWHLAGGKEMAVLKGLIKDPVYRISMSPNGKTVAILEEDSYHVTLWDLTANRKKCSFQVLKNGENTEGYNGVVASIAFSPDSRTLAVQIGSHPVAFWDVAKKKQVGALKEGGDQFRVLAYSPKGDYLASFVTFDRVDVWNTKTGLLKARLDVVATCLAFPPKGTTLVIGNLREMMFWDFTKNKAKSVMIQPATKGKR
jgi:WD40 repeat protein